MEKQATIVTAYTGIAAAASTARVSLESTPPPKIDGGDEVASATATAFKDLADVYSRGAQSVAALTPSTDADLKTAVDAVETEAKTAAPDSLPDLDPGVEAAVGKLPACTAIAGN